ncbi:Glycoside hydrolase family 18 [Lasiodiplodia theobromae]|uniref:Glycoside hydrolase family 18 n=1 Tax=Lasiodiplodia theobromae TaxID=45133 RepID=UPI0015C39D55|nr:Glycoside hydrolase family 18 [Lasiodiplodia theobromae]KAF4544632.1 Glycoside hydrolase family 18 [Lasiodiplodia theobromae]
MNLDNLLTAKFLSSRRANSYPLHLAARAGDTDQLQALIASGHHNLERQHFSHGTPLHAAVYFNQVDAARLLISTGANIEARAPDAYGHPRDTPLTLAARLGHAAVAKLLWDAGARRCMQTDQGIVTPLELAAFGGFSSLVRDLLAWEEDGWSANTLEGALLDAASRWQVEAVKVLLESTKFDQDILSIALVEAAGPKREQHEEIGGPPYADTDSAAQRQLLEVLLAAGADIEYPHLGKRACAVHAAASDPVAIEGMRTLIEKGANVDAQDARGSTPLHIAVSFRKRQGFNTTLRNNGTVMLLVQSGASPAIRNLQGETPMDIAARLGPLSFVQLLLNHGADPLAEDRSGETALHRAAEGDHEDIVELLLSRGADVNKTSSTGWTPLMYAISSNSTFSTSLSLVSLLLERGADPRAASAEGWTALHRAADTGPLFRSSRGSNADYAAAAVELLLAHGADVGARAVAPVYGTRQRLAGQRLRAAMVEFVKSKREGMIVSGQTPLHWAAENGVIPVLETLLRHGADPLAKDGAGATPADRALSSPKTGYTAEQKEVVVELLSGTPQV